MALIEILGAEDASEIEAPRAKDGKQENLILLEVDTRKIDHAEDLTGLEVSGDVKINTSTSTINAQTKT